MRAIANPVQDLTTDAEYVADFLKTLTGPVVLVGHSYGGAVITNAATKSRKVKALVYVDAAAPDVGESNGSLSGKDSVLNRSPESELFDKVPYPGAPPGAADLYLRKDIFIQNFANDLPHDVAARLWASQRAASTEAFDTPSQHAAWRTIPSRYFISSGDQIITPSSELAMAKRAHSRVTLFRGGSHLTLVSHPDAVAQVIIRAAVAPCIRSIRLTSGDAGRRGRCNGIVMARVEGHSGATGPLMTKLVRVVALPGRHFRRHHVCGLHEGRPFASSHSAQGVIRSHLVDARPSRSRRASATPGGAVPHHPRASHAAPIASASNVDTALVAPAVQSVQERVHADVDDRAALLLARPGLAHHGQRLVDGRDVSGAFLSQSIVALPIPS